MSDKDDMERELRIDLMRLERKLKLLTLRQMNHKLVYEPVKLMLLAVGFIGALAMLLLLLRPT